MLKMINDYYKNQLSLSESVNCKFNSYWLLSSILDTLLSITFTFYINFYLTSSAIYFF
jgi:hypothetical protein